MVCLRALKAKSLLTFSWVLPRISVFTFFFFFAFWCKLFRPASFWLLRVCVSFVAFVSSCSANCISKQTGKRHRFPRIRVMCGWCAPVITHVPSGSGVMWHAIFLNFYVPIHSFVNFVTRAHKPLKARFLANPPSGYVTRNNDDDNSCSTAGNVLR